tara:strand:+ start:3694 stop:6195 length:2502 start_codon:yes stop_codon:yes gene_type:complete
MFFPLVLEKEFVQVINFALVNPLFSRFEHSIWLDVLALCFLLILAFKFYQAWINKPFLSITTIVYSLILSLIYFLLFRNTTYWEFLGVFDSGIPYFHLLLLLPICLGILKIRHWLWEKPQITTSLSLADDAPITELEDDDLSRSQSATKIASHIIATHPKKSFALAICAEWGSGKTSYINMIYDATFKEDKSVIWIRFEPCLSQGNDHIIPDFLKELESALTPYNTKIGRTIRSYSKSVSALKNNNLIENLNEISTVFDRPDTIRHLYVSLNESIKSIDRKIIIDIDDIDRLDNQEIVEVLRLIRNTGNFNNTFYICAFDREYIVGALAGINPHKSSSYLEKIFQAEVRLPRFERSVLKDQLINKLTGTIPDEDLKILSALFNEQGKEDLVYSMLGASQEFSSNVVSLCINNLRDITRLVNNIKLVYSNELRNEILIEEFFTVQILSLKYSKEIDLLYQNFTRVFAKQDLFTDTFLNLEKKSLPKNETEDNSLFKEYIHQLEQLGTTNLTFLKNELINLFRHQTQEEASHLSIQWLARFHIIFGISLTGDFFSENNFQDYLKGNIDTFSFFERFKQGKEKIQLVNRLLVINGFKNKEEFLKIVKLWFLIIENRAVEISNIKEMLLYKKNLEKVFEDLEAYTKREYLDLLREWLYNIEPRKKRAEIIGEIIVQSIYVKEQIEFIIPRNELIEQIREVLRLELQEKGISWEAFYLHRLCVSDIEEVSRTITYDKEANGILKQGIEENPATYLELLIMPREENLFMFHPQRAQVFGSDEGFEKWLTSALATHPKYEQLSKIYRQAKQEGVLHEFVFSTDIPKPKWVKEKANASNSD